MKTPFLILIFFAISLIPNALGANRPEIKDNWYYLNGRKFFIKAIGYEIGVRHLTNPQPPASIT